MADQCNSWHGIIAPQSSWKQAFGTAEVHLMWKWAYSNTTDWSHLWHWGLVQLVSKAWMQLVNRLSLDTTSETGQYDYRGYSSDKSSRDKMFGVGEKRSGRGLKQSGISNNWKKCVDMEYFYILLSELRICFDQRWLERQTKFVEFYFVDVFF